MHVRSAVFVTDQVNKHKHLIPAEVIAEGVETAAMRSQQIGIPPGTPSNVGHDIHRTCGWARPAGIHLTSDMARLTGAMLIPETEAEEAALTKLRERFLADQATTQSAPFVQELVDRTESDAAALPEAGYCGAAVLCAPDLAKRLFPDYFCESGTGLVDKDGLTDLRELISRTTEVFPGVFHEPAKDLLLFAHPFFRRSLSRHNSLNQYILTQISAVASDLPELRVRLRLDPDMVGHPASAQSVIELEYWHGPLFNSDISRMPAGVSEYKASETTRFFEGIDRTQFWWKAPESRKGEDGAHRFRTLEAEELVEDPSPVFADLYGCRYVHAEYDLDAAVISHFDGAIRAYAGEAYLQRIGRSIDRAGKQSQYTKLFRFDGEMPVEIWKSLATAYFRGNELIGEYFSGQKSAAPAEARAAPRSPTGDPSLAALVAYGFPVALEATISATPNKVPLAGAAEPLDCIEFPPGALGECARPYIDAEATALVLFEDGIANFPHLGLGDAPGTDCSALLNCMETALRTDIAEDRVDRVSFAFSWRHGELPVTLSCAGQARNVADLLGAMALIVACDVSPSKWISDLKQAVIDCSSGSEDSYDALSYFEFGAPLRVSRPDTKVRIIVPKEKIGLFGRDRDSVGR